MKILVDADACPVRNNAINIARENNIIINLYFDDTHEITSDYANVIMVSKGSDMVDLRIIKELKKGDLVITGDYGLASLVLAKNGLCIHPDGFLYTSANIDELLFKRFLGKKNRQMNKRIIGPKKRTSDLDFRFEELLKSILKEK